MPPPNGGRAAALALGLLSSLPGSALELHLDAGAWRVPAFHLPTPAPLHGLESWQLNGAVQSNQSSNSLALISIAGAAPLAVRPGELIVEGITLLAVYRDHVRVQRGDRQALLYLDNATSQRTEPVASAPAQGAVVEPSATCLSLHQQVPLEELATLGLCPN